MVGLIKSYVRLCQPWRVLNTCLVLALCVPGLHAQSHDLPNDSLMHRQWTLNPMLSAAHSNVLAAWQAQTNHAPVVVAVIDTGIDWTHPDLVNNIWQNLEEDADGDGTTLAFIGGRWQLDPGDLDGEDQDENGYIDDLIGWDFVENDNNPHDFAGHGTHLAGIIGATSNNGIGIAGINPNVQLMALRTGTATNNLTYERGVLAMAYARANGAQIVNLSWGGPAMSGDFRTELMAAEEANILAVAGAGNNARDLDASSNFYPAGHPSNTMLSVAGHTARDRLWGRSNYGFRSVDLTAPGDSIWSTLPNNRYGPSGGTSMATAVVAGVASLVWSETPDLSAAEVRQIILSSVTPQDAYADKVRSRGRLNAEAAVQQAEPVSIQFVEDFNLGAVVAGHVRDSVFTLHNVSDVGRAVTLHSVHPSVTVPGLVSIGARDSVNVPIRFAPQQGLDLTYSIILSDGVHRYFLALSALGEAYPELELITGEVDFSVHVPYNTIPPETQVVHRDTLSWTNTGQAPMEWSLSNPYDGFLSISPVRGVTVPGDTARVVVRYFPERLAFGDDTYMITLHTQSRHIPRVRLMINTHVTTSMESLQNAVIDWGDYDNDGDLDLVMSGLNALRQYTFRLYRNDGNAQFTAIPTSISGLGPMVAIQWGDYDADGDLDLLSSESWGGRIFRNDGQDQITEVARWQRLNSLFEWGDYDADGDLDILGNGLVLRNVRSENWTTLTVVPYQTNSSSSSGTWADYDGDADLDFFRFDAHGGLFRNPGDLRREFLHIQQVNGLDQSRSNAHWMDFNADGALDIVSVGSGLVTYQQQASSSAFARIVRESSNRFRAANGTWVDWDNDGQWNLLATEVTPPSSSQNATGTVLYTLNESLRLVHQWNNPVARTTGMAFGDYDNDLDLDVALSSTVSKQSTAKRPLVVLHQNLNPVPNKPPTIPTNLRGHVDANGIYFTWDKAWDEHTPPDELTYNLWVGTVPDSANVMPAMADLGTGYRRVAAPGNAGTGTTHTLYHLPPGTYYWGVQTIDGQYVGSGFAVGPPFTITHDTRNAAEADSLWLQQFTPPAPVDDATDDAPTDDEDEDGGIREGGQDFPPDSSSPYPIHFALHTPYPNPFTTNTTLAYDLRDDAWVNLTVYNTLGQVVDVLVQRVQKAGRYEIAWGGDARKVPVGVYYIRLEANDFVQVRSFVRMQ